MYEIVVPSGACVCDSGWGGHLCERGILSFRCYMIIVRFVAAVACSSGFYGPGCSSQCRCYGHSVCDPITGACTCPPGYSSFGCWKGMPCHTYHK